MNPFYRLLQRMRRVRERPYGRSKLLQPYEDDSGDAAAGGVTARLPKVPPRLSGGNALTIPREPEITEARATDAI